MLHFITITTNRLLDRSQVDRFGISFNTYRGQDHPRIQLLRQFQVILPNVRRSIYLTPSKFEILYESMPCVEATDGYWTLE